MNLPDPAWSSIILGKNCIETFFSVCGFLVVLRSLVNATSCPCSDCHQYETRQKCKRRIAVLWRRRREEIRLSNMNTRYYNNDHLLFVSAQTAIENFLIGCLNKM